MKETIKKLGLIISALQQNNIADIYDVIILLEDLYEELVDRYENGDE